MSEGGTNTPGSTTVAENAPAESSAVESSILGMRTRFLLVAVFAAVISLLGLIPAGEGADFSDKMQHMFRSYTLGFIYTLAFGLGCVILNLLHNVTGGAWGFSIKRILMAGQKTIPYLGLLFIPLLIAANMGGEDYYPWAGEAREHDDILKNKELYLNEWFWTARAIAFFLIWYGIATLLNRKWKAYEDSGYDGVTGRNMRRLSAPLLIVYVLTMTFASFDWMMSLEPHWFSTMYGALFCVGQVLTMLAFSLVVVNWLTRRAPVFASHYAKKQFHDISALMFAFIVLWTYMSFAQFLIIWSGHLPEETTWYLNRTGGGWGGVMAFLGLFHFLIPFLLLLRLKWKKSAPFLYWCAAAMLVMRLVDLIWQIKPAFQDPTNPSLVDNLAFTDFSVPVAMVSLWFAMFANHLRKAPLMVLENGKLKTAYEEPETPFRAKVAPR